ncbi:MAG: hypothetical protein J0H88_09745 [Sphingomonadales bacterium]|nr:hypothetical protein [Sphingomonadales bacterium]
MLKRHRWIVFALLGLLSGAALFVVVLMAIATGGSGPSSTANLGDARMRDIYSPSISKDPYVQDQWEKSIQALEAACRESGQYCEEARQARRSTNR